MDFALTSEAFKAGDDIPRLYTCRGDDVSPPLTWGKPPSGTRSFALIMQDLDTPVGRLTHWVLYNIPASARTLPAALPPQRLLPDGGLQGRNGLRRSRYLGPCPPWGSHRYVFTLYALDTLMAPGRGLTAGRLLRAMKGHVLAQAELTGRFGKRSASPAERAGRRQ